MSSLHSRKGSTRAALPRRSTRGPLDIEDPLSASQSVSPSPSREAITSSPAASSEIDASLAVPLTDEGEMGTEPPCLSTNSSKDLSFLLDAAIYHPLSNIDVPPPYRYPLPQPPPPITPLDQLFSDLTRLLKQCHFLSAAHLAAIVLTSGLVQATDAASIFHLLSIRYSALELSGNVLLAAQESKALEDLASTFYFDEAAASQENAGLPEEQRPLPRHIMPFDLRLQALRLQGIGFSDTRRTVGALFDLGLECRQNLTRAGKSEKHMWEERLQEIGARVVNALVDLGDLECASRTLRSMTASASGNRTTWTARLILLLIKMGEVEEARTLLQNRESAGVSQRVLRSFIEVADGNFDDAVKTLARSGYEDTDQEALAMATMNLAVAYLYIGEIRKSREILEQLVEKGYSFQALTINLATLYDLTTDKSSDSKMSLVDRTSKVKPAQPQRGFVNADFKL